jgi:uncharacterized protein (TIGR02391 family)
MVPSVFGQELPDFLEMDADEVGLLLLQHIREQDTLSAWNTILGAKNEAQRNGADPGSEQDVGLRVAEGWQWLRNQGLVAPHPDHSGDWETVTRAGRSIDIAAYLQESRSTQLLRVASLAPELREEVLSLFRRGQFETAVFAALRLVEVAVRRASGLGQDMIGVALMKEAFKTGGRLADPSLEAGEQQAYMALFWGAIGSFKNPTSHRIVQLEEPQQAVEVIFLANLLLGVVRRAEGRIAAEGPGKTA